MSSESDILRFTKNDESDHSKFTEEEKAEYEYLRDMTDIPEIPADIEESFRDVMSAFSSYADKSGLSPEQLAHEKDLLEKAFYFAYKAHRNQKRKTGQMYIIHPIATAGILAGLKVDAESLSAAFLHDTIEDTIADSALLTEIFGPAITLLVSGVTKLGKLPSFDEEDQQAGNVRKMMIAMTEDVRVILIKLADRLHNMRTMQYQTPEKQYSKAKETLDIYVPFAEHFGIFMIKWELEDLCLRYLDRDGYYELVGLISAKRSEREEFMATVVSEIDAKLKEYGLKNYDIEGRPKHFYSIYKKMQDKNKDISQIYDMFACRVIVENLTDCYAVLGLVHDMYVPLPGRFKDYIGNPKENGYQSIHTTVKRPGGKTFGETTFEVQVRTYSMHREAEYGIAAHWHYKESGGSKAFKQDSFDKRIDWVRQFLETQKDSDDSHEFLDLLKTNIGMQEVFAFTPKGKVIRLPEGSCPIDFAYAIHTGIGNHMHGAKVNGRIVPLSYEIQTGDVIEIQSSERVKGPSKDWMKMVKTPSARSKINAWFKRENRAEYIQSGKEKLEREIERNAFDASLIVNPKTMEPIIKKFSFQNQDDLYAAIGSGTVTANKVFGRLRDEYLKSLSPEERLALGYKTTSEGLLYYSPDELPDEIGKGDQMKLNKPAGVPAPEKTQEKKLQENKNARKTSEAVSVEGLKNMSLHYANCCKPAPGDQIIGYVTQDGVAIHRSDCGNIQNILKYADRSEKDMERFNRLVEVSWNDRETGGFFHVAAKIIAYDRPGLIIDILLGLREDHVNVESSETHKIDDKMAEVNIVLAVKGLNQFENIMARIRSVPDVVEIQRV